MYLPLIRYALTHMLDRHSIYTCCSKVHCIATKVVDVVDTAIRTQHSLVPRPTARLRHGRQLRTAAWRGRGRGRRGRLSLHTRAAHARLDNERRCLDAAARGRGLSRPRVPERLKGDEPAARGARASARGAAVGRWRRRVQVRLEGLLQRQVPRLLRGETPTHVAPPPLLRRRRLRRRLRWRRQRHRRRARRPWGRRRGGGLGRLSPRECTRPAHLVTHPAGPDARAAAAPPRRRRGGGRRCSFVERALAGCAGRAAAVRRSPGH